MRAIFRPLIRLFFKVRFKGMRNVPARGPYIVAYNHTSLIEPPFILAFWPTQLEALSGHDVWERPGQGQIVKLYGATPVKRGEYDRKVFDVMTAQLAAGRSIAIAPEGGQSSVAELREANPGVAYLIEKMDVPVVPVGVSGSYKGILKDAFNLKRPAITMQIGQAFNLPAIEARGQQRREARQKNADEIMIRIARLLPKKYHGYYAEQLEEQA